MRRNNEMNNEMLEQVNAGLIVAQVINNYVAYTVYDGDTADTPIGAYGAPKDDFWGVFFASCKALACADNHHASTRVIELPELTTAK